MLKDFHKIKKYTAQALRIEADRQNAVHTFFYQEI